LVNRISENKDQDNSGAHSAAPTTSGSQLLKSGSPAINTVNNGYVTIDKDLDGNDRIMGGVVVMGAYEKPNAILPLIIRK
jgi:hypothetical protein